MNPPQQFAPALPTERMLTTREVAKLLNVNPNTLHNWRNAGRIDLPYHAFGRAIRYRAADVEAYLARTYTTPTTEAAHAHA